MSPMRLYVCHESKRLMRTTSTGRLSFLVSGVNNALGYFQSPPPENYENPASYKVAIPKLAS